MKMLKMCLNWKVLVGLGAVGLAIYLVAPELVAASLPILLLAACPLSMLFMMKAMQGSQGKTQGDHAVRQDGADPSSRDEELARLRARQVGLADQIDALERDESRAARDGR